MHGQALVERLDEMQSAYHELARKRAQMMAQDQQIEVLQDKVRHVDPIG